MKTFRIVTLVLAVAFAVAAVASFASNGVAANKAAPKQGYIIKALYGPVCTKVACVNYPLPHAKVQLVFRGRIVKTAYANRKGIAKIASAAGINYRAKITGSTRGRSFSGTFKMAPVPAGRWMDADLSFCANIC